MSSVPRRRSTRRSTRGERSWRWNDAELQRELGAFTAGRKTFPTSREFDAAGRSDLRHAVGDYGGATYWAAKLGLRLRSRQDRSPYSFADALTDAGQVIERFGQLPSVPKLRALGFGRLASVVQAAGGSKRFTALLMNGQAEAPREAGRAALD